jgi:hypothetical protein
MKTYSRQFSSWTRLARISAPGIVLALANFATIGAQQILCSVCTVVAHVEAPVDDGCLFICVDPNDPAPCPEETCCPPGGAGEDCSTSPETGDDCCETSGGPPLGEDPPPGRQGMPHWSVTEPHLGVFFKDTPLWYRPSRGANVEFNLSYKNTPGSNGAVDASQYLIFGVGTNWHTPWRSYMLNRSGTSSGQYMVYLGDGSVNHFVTNAVDYETRARLTDGDTNDTFFLTFNNGIRHRYGPKVTLAGTDVWLITRLENAASNVVVQS